MANDKIYGITNIKSYVPLLLDLDRLNYDSWRELFKTHCIGYSVFDHLDGSNHKPDDKEWCKVDSIVKQWIYGTISQTLLQTILKNDSTARDVWQAIENLFRDNKEAKALELDNELRNIVIGDSTIMEYCSRIKGISDLLTNIGSPVSERNLVTYAINGLSPKYDVIATTIRHRSPFPSFLEMRSILTLEEQRMLQNQNRLVQVSHSDTSSSPTILNANHNYRGQSLNRSNSSSNSGHNSGRGGGKRGGRGGRSGGRGDGRQQQGGGGYPPASYGSGWGGWSFQPTTFPPSIQQHRPFNPPGGLLPTPQHMAQWSNHVPQQQRQNHQTWPTSTGSVQQPFSSHQTQQQQAFIAGQPNTWQWYNFPNATDQPTALPQAFSSMTLQDPGNADWYMDTGLLHIFMPTQVSSSLLAIISVGDGSRIPVTHMGTTTLTHNPYRTLSLNNVLITPQIIKNLISVRQFTRDNKCTIEFDEFGFSVKDYRTRQILLRCDSTSDLYPVTAPSPQAFLSVSPSTWHQRLGHPGQQVFKHLISKNFISCNKKDFPLFCHACQLGKHVRLSFALSQSNAISPFHVIHSDVWTSPVQSHSGIKFYVIFLDQFSHFVWVYPLRQKSEVFSKFLHFRAYVQTQFRTEIQIFQCDNGKEFDNKQFHHLCDTHGIHMRFSCPYTSQQTGTHLPPTYWVEALHMASHLLNILPSTALHHDTPFHKLFDKQPSYSHLRVFGCLCYPHLNNSHKLEPRSTPCIFLGYPSNHKGYRCLNLHTKQVIISRHVVFDESTFPFGSMTPNLAPSYDFLDLEDNRNHFNNPNYPSDNTKIIHVLVVLNWLNLPRLSLDSHLITHELVLENTELKSAENRRNCAKVGKVQNRKF
ncbi:hypothetical protein OSB04_un001838 [Centaurea solstitialis]|uniref:Integrase catalytic domain-containing protein n=1 Tax=Centaurea solstitialis TaxID=347529 RepID=A0AA38W4P5_9ASTR|nr:hypothetical protein OSB04_un001838 [Centaurea solstitialis]